MEGSLRTQVLFTHLFTPYGYKFEEKAGWSDNQIFENYDRFNMQRAVYQPWRLPEAGIMSIDPDVKITLVEGKYCGSTVLTKDNTRFYFTDYFSLRLYPSHYSTRSMGNSVRRYFSISLFTPYGYKFTGKDESGWTSGNIYESYKYTSVTRPQMRPWRVVANGWIELGREILVGIIDNCTYWSGDAGTISGNAVHFWTNDWALFPGYSSSSKFGYSVHRHFSNSLFTPYGYKFEDKDGNVVYENNNSNIQWMNKSPWKVTFGGNVSWGGMAIENIAGGTGYWHETSYLTEYAVYESYMDRLSLRQSNYGSRLLGFSVRKV